MERLTERDGFGNADIIGVDSEDLQLNLDFDGLNKVTDALNKLAEYEDLEEQGLLLKLPCKNWMDIVFGEQETFWGIDKDYIENPIREITVDNAERFTWYDGWETVVLKGADENGLDWEFYPSEIGKTVFLTKAEAEEALKKMEGDRNKSRHF